MPPSELLRFGLVCGRSSFRTVGQSRQGYHDPSRCPNSRGRRIGTVAGAVETAPSASEAASSTAASGPEPGIAHLDVDRIGSRAVGEIQSGVQPELAGEFVAKSNAAAAHTLPI